MLKKKVHVKLGRVPPKQAKSQPQWDELNAWCQQTTAKLASMDRKLTAIIATMSPNQNVSTELEKAINKNAALTRHVDRQVPDEQPTKKRG